MYYNGKRVRVWRRYDSLKNFIGENKVYQLGDILCVSTRNNDDYDLFLEADGKSRFIDLYNRHKEKAIDTVEEVVKFLGGFSGDKTLKEILRGLITVTEEQDESGVYPKITIDTLDNV